MKKPRDPEPKGRSVWDLGTLAILGVMLFGGGILIGYLIAAAVWGFLGN